MHMCFLDFSSGPISVSLSIYFRKRFEKNKKLKKSLTLRPFYQIFFSNIKIMFSNLSYTKISI